MYKKVNRKLMALALSLVMLFGLGTTALAATNGTGDVASVDGEVFDSLQDAIDTLLTGDTAPSNWLVTLHWSLILRFLQVSRSRLIVVYSSSSPAVPT